MIGSEQAAPPRAAASPGAAPADTAPPEAKASDRSLPYLIAGAFVLAVISVLVINWVPSSDPWAWIDWGQEITSSHISLSLAGGPSWKPFPVVFTTVFGLFGHAWEMAERSGVGIELDGDALPLYPGALEAAEAGVRTGGDPRNRSHLEGHVLSDAPPAVDALAFDPQTSGGLLAAVPPQLAGELWDAVGRVVEGPPRVHLRWGD